MLRSDNSKIIRFRLTPSVLGFTALFLSSTSFTNSGFGQTELIFLSISIGIGTFGIYSVGQKIALFNPLHTTRSSIYSLVLIATFIFAIYFINCQPETLPQAILQLPLAAALTVAYYRNFDSGRIQLQGLRAIPFVKNAVLALAWALATTPLWDNGGVMSHVFVFRFLFILSLGIAVDIRDSASDLHQDTKTLPLLIGSRYSALTASGILLLASAWAWNTLLPPGAPPLERMIIPLHTICTALGVLYLPGQTKPITYFWLVDLQMLMHALMFLWVSKTI